jgi:hypothetical protein
MYEAFEADVYLNSILGTQAQPTRAGAVSADVKNAID